MIPKPKPCNENWLEMTKTTGGRTCHSCNKKITDFSKKSWAEIAQMHREKTGQLCGMYSNKQLKYWGQQPPKVVLPNCSKALLLVSSMLAALPLSGQVVLKDTVELHSAFNKSKEKVLENKNLPASYIISGTVVDSVHNEPLIGVNIIINGTSTGVSSDIDGNFHLDITDIWAIAKDTTVEFSYIGYNPRLLRVSEIVNKKLEVGLNHGTVFLTDFSISAPPPFFKRVWWKIKGVFRKNK